MSEHRDDLVEPEGVNAASADATAEFEAPHDADVLSGGRPDRAPGVQPDEEERGEEMIGTPRTTPPDAGQPAGPPGQDSGSAE